MRTHTTKKDIGSVNWLSPPFESSYQVLCIKPNTLFLILYSHYSISIASTGQWSAASFAFSKSEHPFLGTDLPCSFSSKHSGAKEIHVPQPMHVSSSTTILGSSFFFAFSSAIISSLLTSKTRLKAHYYCTIICSKIKAAML